MKAYANVQSDAQQFTGHAQSCARKFTEHAQSCAQKFTEHAQSYAQACSVMHGALDSPKLTWCPLGRHWSYPGDQNRAWPRPCSTPALQG